MKNYASLQDFQSKNSKDLGLPEELQQIVANVAIVAAVVEGNMAIVNKPLPQNSEPIKSAPSACREPCGMIIQS